MIGIKVTHERQIEDKIPPLQQLEAAKRQTLIEAQGILRQEQAADRFPTRKEDYEFRLFNRGSESRRDFATIQPAYLRIPYSMVWTSLSDDVEPVRQAALFAVATLRRRVPVVSGAYLGSVNIWVGGRTVSASSLASMDLEATAFVTVAPAVPYAATIERGYYKGSYDTPDAGSLRGGIVRPVAALVRGKFPEVNCRFLYLARGNRNVPALDIGVAGSFLQNDARPGQARRGRRRARR